MGIVSNSLYRFSEKDKQEILDDLTPPMPPEDIMAEFREMFQSFTEKMNSQEEESRILREKVDYLIQETKQQHEQFDLLRKELVSLRSRNTEFVVPSAKPKPAKKIDRSKFRPLLDGEKEVREIPESWEEIFDSIDDGTYRKKYKIGNYKPLDLGSEGIIRMQIAGFDADPLADGSGRAAITWIAMDLLKTEYRMNPEYENDKIGTGALGGWKKSEMRSYLDNDIKSILPANVESAVKPVLKHSASLDSNGNDIGNEITEDVLWIPSVVEVFGSEYYFSEYEDKALYYSSLFLSDKDRVKSAAWWWLRSAGNYGSFPYVSTSGSYYYRNAGITGSVALSFCT